MKFNRLLNFKIKSHTLLLEYKVSVNFGNGNLITFETKFHFRLNTILRALVTNT